MLSIIGVIMESLKKLFGCKESKVCLDMLKSSVKCEDEFWSIR